MSKTEPYEGYFNEVYAQATGDSTAISLSNFERSASPGVLITPSQGALNYASAISPETGPFTPLRSQFQLTTQAAVKQSDPNYSIQSGYSLPPEAPKWPKAVAIGLAGFAIYWFFIRKG